MKKCDRDRVSWPAGTARVTGVFGLLDPDGPHASDLIDAAAAGLYRGNAVTARSGPIVVGVYEDGSDDTGLFQGSGSVLAADVRVDGALPNSIASDLAGSFRGIALLDEIFRQVGPDGLMGLAADFSLARFEEGKGQLHLARDAFGLRPLYWAKAGRRFAFASDVLVLRGLGLASGELDVPAIGAYLARFGLQNGRTAFKDVHTVRPGSWLAVDLDGRSWEGRWFHPEELVGRPLGAEEAVEATRSAVLDAVGARARGGAIGVALSGGRDSGAVAVALAELGISATCVTQCFDRDLPVDETGPARWLAEQMGHRWLTAFVPSSATARDLDELPEEAGSPLGSFAFPQSVAPAAAAASTGVDVLFTGQGGEPLFSPAPVAVLDLIRKGHLRQAALAAHNFDRKWTYSYAVIAKAAGRALAPRQMILARERLRRLPPWLSERTKRAADLNTAPRNAREHLVNALVEEDATGFELEERIHARRRVKIVHPLLDMRVVAVALRLRLEDRAPIREPKPVIAAAFLGTLAASRVKMRFTRYYQRLAGSIFDDFPDIVMPSKSFAAEAGIVDPRGLLAARDPFWSVEALPLVPLETWLRMSL